MSEFDFPTYEMWLEPHGLGHAILSEEAERELGLLTREGDETARDTLALSNLRLIWKLAIKYTRPDSYNAEERRMDLFNAGVQATVHAIPKWDPDRGYRLAPYIWRAAERAMYEELESSVNNPLTDEALDDAARWELQHGESVGFYLRQAIAEGELDEEQALEMLRETEIVKWNARQLAAPLLLDETPLLSYPDKPSLVTYLPDPESAMENGTGNSFWWAREERKAQLQGKQIQLLDLAFAAGGLSEREIEVLMRRHGIDFPYCETYEELGQAMEMTKSGARKLYIRALNKARAGAAELGDEHE